MSNKSSGKQMIMPPYKFSRGPALLQINKPIAYSTIHCVNTSTKCITI